VKVLLDECVDPKARRFFSEQFEVQHLKHVGLLGTKNGELVRLASESFDVLFTIDSNMRHQTSISGLSLIVVVASGHFRSVDACKNPIESFESRLSEFQPGNYYVL
jgi:predicted nuclease of predicted toxin-antitoxin system